MLQPKTPMFMYISEDDKMSFFVAEQGPLPVNQCMLVIEQVV